MSNRDDFEFKITIGKLQLISNSKSIRACGGIAEISELNPDGTRYAIAYWTSNTRRDEFSLQFVGSRPFESDRIKFWHLAQEGYRLLESWHPELTEE